MNDLLLTLRNVVLMAVLVMLSSTAKAQVFYENGIYYEGNYDSSNPEAVVISSYEGYRGDIEIPATVTTLIYCDYEEFEASFTVVGIADEAFRNCNELTSVVLPNTIRSIGRNAFYGCSILSDINLPSSLTSIGASAFGYCTSLTSMDIPNSVTTIGWNAFYCCTGLTDVTISTSVAELNGTFFGCTGLTSVEIPQSVTKLDGTFTGCTGLTAVNVPASVGYIGARTFDGCTALASVVLPSSLTYIAEQAFFNCENLKTITCLAATPPSMYTNDSECFDYSSYMDGLLFVPSAAIPQYQSTDWWSLFQHVRGLITLNVNSMTLYKGRSFKLTATFAPGFNPDDPISWRSSNTAIVKVTADGTTRAIAVGVAVVYATVGDEEASCEVIVLDSSNPVGDIDGDGEVGIADLSALIDLILSGEGDPDLHDVDGDGVVNISDVSALIDIILGH